MIPSWAATAAAVLAVGTLVQSPIPKMLGNLVVVMMADAYLVCCRVSLSTQRKPPASTRAGLVRRASGVDMGGVMCSRS